MRLVELKPKLLKMMEMNRFLNEGVAIEKADGIQFLCPKCFEANGFSAVGTHSVICWRPRVDASILPGPGRWEIEGSSFENLSLTAGSSSVELTGNGCHAHFFVKDGEVTNA